MLLLAGPAGSGKTSRVAARFREALRRQDSSTRLLVPTATMARHLQNQFAREGFVFRPGLIQTLSRFMDAFAEDLPAVSEPAFYLIVEEAARRVDRPEFAPVVRLPGFCASLARVMAEFSSAGCDAARLAAHLPHTPLGPAFLAIYEEVDRELARRGLAMRAARLERVAQRIGEAGMPGIAAVLLDGFHALPDPELTVIAAMGRRAELVLTLPTSPATAALRERLLAMGFAEEACRYQRPEAPVEVTAAATVEREADEIARCILDEAAQGRPFREVGIVVRSADVYEPLLRATLERFGIPARFYFDADLARHPVARFLAGAIDAMLGGWDYGAVLEVVRLAAALGRSAAADWFDFEVRERLPGAGLAGLREIAGGDGALVRLLDALAPLEEWRTLALPPREWGARARGLRALFPPPRPTDGVSHETAAIWRGQAAVLDAVDEAAGAAVAALAGRAELPFPEYWRAFQSVLRLTPLRLDDNRRDVVHVLGAHEARQWRLPVVFVCGLVEKQFPRLHRQDPFFPDAARRELARAGIRVRTAAEFEMEERALFEAALTRATGRTVLSYPKTSARGERNLPSLFLDAVLALRTTPPAVRPAPLFVRSPWRPAPALRHPELLAFVARKTAALSPTALEAFLHCPFRFFGDQLLRLEPPPAAPEERFDALAQGNLVHAVIAAWHRAPQPIEPLFERIFRETCAELNIPPGYHTEAVRHRLFEDVRAFAAFEGGPEKGIETRTEQAFEYELEEGLRIRGRVDRLEILAGNRGFVVDYKYSSAARTRQRVNDDNSLQPPLYLLAVERFFGLAPAGMQYCALRGGVKYEGPWRAPFEPGWIEGAIARSVEAAARIRAGEIAPQPAGGEPCDWCANRDVCRYDGASQAMTAEGA